MTDVVVTGYGAATPFGRGARALHEGMVAGESKVEVFGPKDARKALSPGYGGEVRLGARDLRDLPNSRDMRPGTMTRYTHLATLALGDAMAHGDVPWDDGDGALERGYYVASYTNSDKFDKYVRFAHHVTGVRDGEPVIVDERVPDAIRKFSGFEFLKLMNNMPTAHGGIQGRCQGPCNTFLGTPAGGAQAIGRAREAIVDGLASTMYAGGVGSACHAQMMMTRATRGLASAAGITPAEAGRPFDKKATGIVPGEAGGMLVLERRDVAEARNATIHATLAGYGEWFTPPAGDRSLPPSPEGTVRAARKALAQAGIEASDIDLVVAHGESRLDLDALEAEALAQILGARVSEVPVLATAAHIGAVEAAAAPLGAALALECMRTGVVPGALNRGEPIDAYKGPTGTEPVKLDVRHALVTITTREGINAALVLSRA